MSLQQRIFSQPMEENNNNNFVFLVKNRAGPKDDFKDVLDHLQREGVAVDHGTQWPSNLKQWRKLANQNGRLVLMFNEAPNNGEPITHIYKVLMDSCVQQRSRKVDLRCESGGYNRLIEALKDDTGRFSSPGESFAWQLVTGFLCYILPFLSERVSRQLADDSGSARLEALRKFNIPAGVNAERVLVVPKYFLLLSRAVASGLKAVQISPEQLFPGCRKISNSRSELEFDSPGYKKRIPVYLAELNEPLSSGHTHAMIFCGFAAPMFVIRQLELSQDERGAIFDDFKNELQYILSHPGSSQLLSDLSGAGHAPTEVVPSAVGLVELVSSHGDSLKEQILKEVKQAAVSRQWDLCDAPVNGDDVDGEDGEWTMVEASSAADKGKPLLVKFGSSVEPEVRSSIQDSLSNLGFEVDIRQRQRLPPNQRVLLVLHTRDLSPVDQRTQYEIQHAVENMHHNGCFNVSVIIVTEGQHVEAFETLPSCLQCIPDQCVVVVSNLTQLLFSVPYGTRRLTQFSDLVKELGLDKEPIRADDSLPLMSMAFAMATNCWFGFAQHLLQSIRTSPDPRQLQFCLPYCFIIPKSCRFPEEKQLYEQLERNGVSWRLSEFHLDDRRYTFRVHRWGEFEIAFEVPASMLAIRRQAECCIGGIRARRLSSQLDEFGDELNKYCEGSDYFRVVYWDDQMDETARDDDSKLAKSLMECLQQACRDYQ